MNRSAERTLGPVSPSFAHSLRTWKLCRPIGRIEMLLEDPLAVSRPPPSRSPRRLRSTPSAPVSRRRGPARCPGTIRGRCRSLFRPSTCRTVWPAGPVWIVTSFLPSNRPATVAASSALRTSCTPRWSGSPRIVPLPRPPAWICDLTTATAAPSSRNASAASSAVRDNDARQHSHARIAKNLLGLEFVDFHQCIPRFAAPKSTGRDCRTAVCDSQPVGKCRPWTGWTGSVHGKRADSGREPPHVEQRTAERRRYDDATVNLVLCPAAGDAQSLASNLETSTLPAGFIKVVSRAARACQFSRKHAVGQRLQVYSVGMDRAPISESRSITMTRTIAHRIVRPISLACSTLVVALAVATASAQGPPDPPPGPPDPPSGPAADQADDFRPGMPEHRFGPQWPGPSARGRAFQPAAERLDQLDVKLDTLLNEVRQLRREIHRQRAGMSPGPRGSQFGPQFGPWSYPGTHRGGFRPDGQQAPYGPRFNGSQGWFGPPWGGPRGGPGMMRDRESEGPRRENMDRGPDGPRRNNMDRRPDGPRGENMDRGPDGPRRDGEDRRPDGRA